ncbi:hypothetical protein E2C01_074187 [Portunus trituberculatus]|uniref:Uncharacterized protein n=1 Tax=Portunus trituberculatus TaxID=210409 RepID=A0A5B7I526_PORTR|nr:hypothetical protein [Portunus trituberculatus]
MSTFSYSSTTLHLLDPLYLLHLLSMPPASPVSFTSGRICVLSYESFCACPPPCRLCGVRVLPRAGVVVVVVRLSCFFAGFAHCSCDW